MAPDVSTVSAARMRQLQFDILPGRSGCVAKFSGVVILGLLLTGRAMLHESEQGGDWWRAVDIWNSGN
jgi:hypothetical protein